MNSLTQWAEVLTDVADELALANHEHNEDEMKRSVNFRGRHGKHLTLSGLEATLRWLGEAQPRSLPSYYREMLVRGHPAYLGSHHRDSYLMERLARERRYRPEQSAARRHFYRAWQGCTSSEIQDAAARGW